MDAVRSRIRGIDISTEGIKLKWGMEAGMESLAWVTCRRGTHHSIAPRLEPASDRLCFSSCLLISPPPSLAFAFNRTNLLCFAPALGPHIVECAQEAGFIARSQLISRRLRSLNQCADSSSWDFSFSSFRTPATPSDPGERTGGEFPRSRGSFCLRPSTVHLLPSIKETTVARAMLHEVLLSLSGQPSPLLRASGDSESCAHAGITPPERQLLASAARLGDVHKRLTDCVARVSASHPSVICRAVAAAIQSGPLAAFQRKVLQVEDGILKQDPDLVGAYNSVPLTAVISHFQPWVRKMDWLQDLTRFIEESDGGDREVCRGAALIDRLRVDLQSGYLDVAESALGLVSAAESAWLRQLSAWILYGRLPAYGGEDFFVQKSPTLEDVGLIIAVVVPAGFMSPPK